MVVYYKETSRMEVIMGKKVCYVLVRVGERPWCSQDLTVPWETYISEDLDMVDFTELRAKYGLEDVSVEFKDILGDDVGNMIFVNEGGKWNKMG